MFKTFRYVPRSLTFAGCTLKNCTTVLLPRPIISSFKMKREFRWHFTMSKDGAFNKWHVWLSLLFLITNHTVSTCRRRWILLILCPNPYRIKWSRSKAARRTIKWNDFSENWNKNSLQICVDRLRTMNLVPKVFPYWWHAMTSRQNTSLFWLSQCASLFIYSY